MLWHSSGNLTSFPLRRSTEEEIRRTTHYVKILVYLCNLPPIPLFSCSIHLCVHTPLHYLIAVESSTLHDMSPLIPLDCIQLPVILSLQSFPCRADLPCLLTDNSDRKLLHVITLLKSQFTHASANHSLVSASGNGNCLLHFTSSNSPARSKPSRVSVCGRSSFSMFYLAPRFRLVLFSLLLFPFVVPLLFSNLFSPLFFK